MAGSVSKTTIWLAALLLVALLAALGIRRGTLGIDGPDPLGDDEPLVSEGEAWPAGRWHLRDRLEDSADERGETARLLSLPYTGAGGAASDEVGVTVHDPERAFPGLNLYTSGHAPEAILMAMDGRVLRRWRYPFERAFPDRRPTVETPFFRRARLLPDGDLLAIYQGGGMVRLDADSRPVWTLAGGFYNDLHVARDGSVWTIAKEARILPALHPTEPVLEDFVVVIAPDGRIVRRTSLLRAFTGSSFSELLEGMKRSGDVFHTNTVELLEAPGDADPEAFPAGSVLVSLREVDVIATVDPRRETVLWARRGPWKAQHEPTLVAGGGLLLFDNRGADGNSRALEIDPLSGATRWEYRGPAERPLASPEAGSCQRLANGNTLITESEAGRALEVTAAGEVVWEFVSPHRAGAGERLVATLFEVLRLPTPAAPRSTP